MRCQGLIYVFILIQLFLVYARINYHGKVRQYWTQKVKTVSYLTYGQSCKHETDFVTSHEEVSWPHTLRQEIQNIHTCLICCLAKWAKLALIYQYMYNFPNNSLKENFSQLNNCYNTIHYNFLFLNSYLLNCPCQHIDQWPRKTRESTTVLDTKS
jgi:hypothetical protein